MASVSRRVREFGTLKALGWRAHLTVTVIGPPGAGGPPGGVMPVPVHFSAPVSPGIIALAVALGIAGGLLAGTLGAWRAALLRPATALAQVG